MSQSPIIKEPSGSGTQREKHSPLTQVSLHDGGDCSVTALMRSHS